MHWIRSGWNNGIEMKGVLNCFIYECKNSKIVRSVIYSSLNPKKRQFCTQECPMPVIPLLVTRPFTWVQLPKLDESFKIHFYIKQVKNVIKSDFVIPNYTWFFFFTFIQYLTFVSKCFWQAVKSFNRIADHIKKLQVFISTVN